MSVYNGEKYLREAIDSILNQTYKDFEFIIVNDASTDKTELIIKEFMQKDQRIKLINNEINCERSVSRNKAIQVSKGEYIAMTDGDDISFPKRLETQVRYLEENKDIALVGTSWYYIDDQGREISIQESLSGNKKQIVHFMCKPSVMVRKSCLQEVGGFREVFVPAEDYDLCLRIIDNYEIGIIKEPLYKYRVHANSSTSCQKNEMDLCAALAIEMAEERRKFGRDRLSLLSQEDAMKLRDQRLKVSGIKKRKILSHNYSTQSQAAFALGEYVRALDYSINSLSWYVLNYQAWSILIKVVAREYRKRPIGVTRSVLKFLIKKVKSYA